MRHVLAHEGWRAFYRGMLPSMVGVQTLMLHSQNEILALHGAHGELMFASIVPPDCLMHACLGTPRHAARCANKELKASNFSAHTAAPHCCCCCCCAVYLSAAHLLWLTRDEDCACTAQMGILPYAGVDIATFEILKLRLLEKHQARTSAFLAPNLLIGVG